MNRTAILACASLATMLGATVQSQSPTTMNKGLTEVAGLRVGHYTMEGRPTGCTVVLVDGDGAVGGVSQRGGAPGTRETDLLNPLNTVDRVNAIVLSGGSAFGLDTAQGVMKDLEERKVGVQDGLGRHPDRPRRGSVRPRFRRRSEDSSQCGLRVPRRISSRQRRRAGGQRRRRRRSHRRKDGRERRTAFADEGRARLGRDRAAERPRRRRPGRGEFSGRCDRSPVGTGRCRRAESRRHARGPPQADCRRRARAPARPAANTTVGLVATNARLTKEQASRVALMADDGLARAINPSHTLGDGDTIFALATGRWDGEINVSLIGALAAEAMSESIVRAVAKAESLGGLRSARELGTVPARLR